MAAKLTPKQQRFVDEYLVDLNATQAAIRAGYSSKTANRMGSENLSKPVIADAIQKAQAERSKRTGITQDRVLEQYARISAADIKDFLSFCTEKTVVGREDDGTPIFDYKQIVQMKPSDEVDGTLISEVSISERGVFTFKLYDKMKALDMLGRHLGMFKDKVELTGSDGKPLFEVVVVKPPVNDDGEEDED